MLTNDIQFLEMEISSRCNAECPGCPRTQILSGKTSGGFAPADLSLADVMRILPRENFQPARIKFCGNLGDPAMNPECLEIASHILDRNIAVSIHTNGGLRSEKFWKAFGELSQKHNGRLKTVFAVDGLEDTNHIYRVNVKWTVLLRNMKAYLAAGGHAEWHYIPFDHNTHQIEEAQSLAATLGLKFVLRKAIRNHKGWQNKHSAKITANMENVGHAEVRKYTEARLLLEEYSKNSEDVRLHEPLKVLGESVSCWHAHKNSLLIDSQGRLWPCCMLYDSFIKAQDSRFMESLPSDPEWNKLTIYAMQNILDSNFYRNISQRWNPTEQSFTSRCLRDCGQKGAFQAKLEALSV